MVLALILVSRLESVLIVVLALVPVIALAPVWMSASVFVWEKAMRFQSRPKKLVTMSLRANFLFAETAWGLVSET